MRELKSFKIRIGNKILDYRESDDLDLDKISTFFRRKYQIKKIWKEPRHIVGILSQKNKLFFLKLSGSEGIGLITQNEFNWNNYFNKYNLNSNFLVPKNYDSGFFDKKYFYVITDFFEGQLLCDRNGNQTEINKLAEYIPEVIKLSEAIQNLPQTKFLLLEYEEKDFRVRFLNKTKGWLKDIPSNVIKQYKLNDLLKIVEKGINGLDARPRHGDFTPWHMIKLKNGKLCLIDGEHALPDGVENYDICYFIQRIFGILQNPKVAQEIYAELIKKGYNKEKLRIVLASRAIGGFLDVTLNNEPDYQFADKFKSWVLNT